MLRNRAEEVFSIGIYVYKTFNVSERADTRLNDVSFENFTFALCKFNYDIRESEKKRKSCRFSEKYIKIKIMFLRAFNRTCIKEIKYC